jgi:hypothetical protein
MTYVHDLVENGHEAILEDHTLFAGPEMDPEVSLASKGTRYERAATRKYNLDFAPRRRDPI